MKAPLVSSKKILLSSQYSYFDLLPIKKFQQCNMRIPETVLLDRGFVKDWVFNSHKIANHPILKKRKQNLSPFTVVKTFCIKQGYGQAIQGCINIQQIRDRVKQVIKQQKDYDYVKNKKAIQITTVSDQILVMTLLDFLDYVGENKYTEQNFYQKWKIIQQKVSFTKIDEYYKVDNIRNNHIIQSKCQKIISMNTTEAKIQSIQIQQDPYKKSSPSKSVQIAQTKNVQGYKFFDTFLNKKFFQMSADLIEFIEKNLKCLVQSVITKFVINKQREPYLISISDLQIKPAKKIADMREFQLSKQKGYIKIQQYQKFLQTYIHQNLDKIQFNTPLLNGRKRCKGKFCKLIMQDITLPSYIQHKLRLPTLSATSRVISIQLRDAVYKRRRKVMEKLVQYKIVKKGNQLQDQSSQYQTQDGNQQPVIYINKQRTRQAKVCQNCYTFYFHVVRFFDLDIYANLAQKKILQLPTTNQSFLDKSQMKGLNFMTKQQLKLQRQLKLDRSLTKENSKSKLQNMSEDLINKKWEAQQKVQYQLETKQIKNDKTKQQLSNSQKQHRLLKHSKSNLNVLTPIKQKASLSKAENQIKSDKKLQMPMNSKSKIKLDPLNPTKKQIIQQSSISNQTDTKTNYRLLALTKLSKTAKLYSKQKSKTMRADMLPIKQRRPENMTQAIEQLIKKLSALPDSSKQELIYYAKKYYKDNLPQPIDRRSYSTYYQGHLYQFMSITPISIHPKRRIKKRPQMSLKRLSQLTDYPEIVSRSQFIFDTIIINQQTTIPFCVLTTKVVNPDNLRTGQPFQNIFIINDIFDCFIEHISMVKQLLEQDQVYNKRIILFNYPGQSHTIYNRGNQSRYSVYFCQVFDKLLFRLSGQKQQLKIIDLQKDYFKFCGFGYGGFLAATYLGSYSSTFANISGTLIVNSFMQYPVRYKQILESLLQLYSSNDPTVQSQACLYYNISINSQQTTLQQLQHKVGLNPIRVQDRIYLLQCLLNEYKDSETTTSLTIQPQYFQQQTKYPISIVYGKNNKIITKQNCYEFMKYRNNNKVLIQKRVFIQISGGHDILADNYQDIFRVLTLFITK